jgi:hypothetical protein
VDLITGNSTMSKLREISWPHCDRETLEMTYTYQTVMIEPLRFEMNLNSDHPSTLIVIVTIITIIITIITDFAVDDEEK